MEKPLYNADLFIAENSILTHRDSITNINDIDCIISSRAIYNNIQNLFLNNDLSLDHSAILSDFSTNIDKYTSHPIKIKLYYKANWDFISSSFCKQLAILKDQISDQISLENTEPINIIDNGAIILTDTIMSINNHLPENQSSNQIPVYHFPVNFSSNKKNKTKERSLNPETLFSNLL